MAIFDTMNFIKSDVSTLCIGMAASMGAFLLALAGAASAAEPAPIEAAHQAHHRGTQRHLHQLFHRGHDAGGEVADGQPRRFAPDSLGETVDITQSLGGDGDRGQRHEEQGDQHSADEELPPQAANSCHQERAST